MPQMSPYSWMTLLLMMNLMMNLFKLNLFFEEKC
uniref:ATP synthase F0 subunit 8 n=1 Tax=Sogata hakonensis TaxID=871477 RepID=A0A7S5DBV0_9HEMI|nr:ATP synthase F0 subunit 8 [Sogata hakonensis]